MSEAYTRACAYIDEHREEIIDFLKTMISYKSINPAYPDTGKELEVQQWLRDRFNEFGFFQNVDFWAVDEKQERPNVVGVLKGTGGGRSLILNGHVDVVPVPPEELPKWKTDPWRAEVTDGKLYGRGASDMKGGLTSIIWAVKALAETGTRLKGDLFLESVVGEESGEGANLGAQAAVDRGYKADFCIVAEPSHGTIRMRSPGIFFFELVIPGKEAHIANRNLAIFPQKHGVPSGPEVGADAIIKAVPFIELFQRLENQWNHKWKDEMLPEEDGIGTFTINPCFIQGGNYGASVVPGSCRILYNVRYPHWMNDEELWEELKRHVQAIASTDDWLRENPPEFKVPVVRRWQPMIQPPIDHPGVQTLVKAYKEITGGEERYVSFKGLGDTTFITRSGIPAVNFGPGSSNFGVHGPNEYVEIDNLIEFTKVFARTILEWCEEE